MHPIDILHIGRLDAPHGKKIKDPQKRRKMLEENPYISYMTPIGVHCMPCGKNIRCVVDFAAHYRSLPILIHLSALTSDMNGLRIHM